ncbi:zinc metalloprotease HtpX [Hyphomicrobium sp. DY-1]|uniref:zinc metalloprotease HtpX n=1 Tax=Hyphomicrobium sp. DY-1 TaxID=3075650 RepID=UPI0039C38218
MDLPGDFGTFLRANRWPPFHVDGIPGSSAACGMVDISRAFAPCDRSGNPSAPFQPQSQRAENDRLSRHVRAGLLLLLASCGWIVGGDEGVRRAVARGTPCRNRGPEMQNAPRDHFAIRTLEPADAPELFAEIDRICWRAKLPQRPRICVLIGQRAMNAYAFGGPNDAIVTFTEGLLRGMTTKEVGAIFAHEIAHICNGDSATMSWAAQLQRAINDVAAAGLAPVHAFGAVKQQSSLQWVLTRAPAIAELLMLALSRFREIEADAFALELTGDAKTLETALAKLEHHHRALSGIPEGYIEDRLASYLRSHPVTSERIGHLRASPLYGAA